MGGEAGGTWGGCYEPGQGGHDQVRAFSASCQSPLLNLNMSNCCLFQQKSHGRCRRGCSHPDFRRVWLHGKGECVESTVSEKLVLGN